MWKDGGLRGRPNRPNPFLYDGHRDWDSWLANLKDAISGRG